jgi:PAS domain-containing protein
MITSAANYYSHVKVLVEGIDNQGKGGSSNRDPLTLVMAALNSFLCVFPVLMMLKGMLTTLFWGVGCFAYFMIAVFSGRISGMWLFYDVGRNIWFVLFTGFLLYLTERNKRLLFLKLAHYYYKDEVWRDIMQNLSEPILLIDPTFSIKYVNQSMMKLFKREEKTENSLIEGLATLSQLNPRQETRQILDRWMDKTRIFCLVSPSLFYNINISYRKNPGRT